MDIWTKEKRSSCMSKIRGSNTIPEKTLRSALHRAGFRFRINVKKLPGKPDIVLKRHNLVIFVHGCFWHHHEGCKNGNFPKSNKEFWHSKITKTMERDMQNVQDLISAGWNVLTIWECEIEKNLNVVLKAVVEKSEIDTK
ncbi:MAG: very short patch repair endonuclease [Bacteroidetes bacterium]|nr:very short patch repair endonuclease [Bacteroidota bacterium]